MITQGENVQEPLQVVSQAEGGAQARVDAALSAIDSTMEAEVGAEGDQAPEPDEGLTPAEGSEAAERTPEPEGETSLTDEEAAPDAEMESSRLAARSRRERQKRETREAREEEHRARAHELDEREASLKTRGGSLDDWASLFRSDPQEALKQINITDGLGEVANMLYAIELGEEAPPELLSMLRARESEARIEKLERRQKDKFEQLEEREQALRHEEFQRGYVASIDNHMRAVPEDLVYAKVMYQVNPEQAVEMMYSIAVQNAQENPRSSESSPAVLAEALNSQMAQQLEPIIQALIELELAKQGKDSSPAGNGTTAEPKTLRNADNAKTSKRPPANTDEDRVSRAVAALSDPAYTSG